MTAEDLEKMNRKLMRENENYVNAYRARRKTSMRPKRRKRFGF